MLSTPHKRFTWARSEKFSEFTFFRTLIQRRPRKEKRLSLMAELMKKTRRSATWNPWMMTK